jgi:hypothetical protein
MNFMEALDHLASGYYITLPEWGGYWYAEPSGNIAVRTRDGETFTDPWIVRFHRRTDWIATLPEV